MTKLTRYLVLLAGVALAMLVSVPAASALANSKPTDQGPDSHSCKDATDRVEHIKKEIWDVLKELTPEEDSQAPEKLAKLKADPKKTPQVVHKIDVIEKLIELRDELVQALKLKHKVCEKPKESPDTTAAATISQVRSVPTGSVSTGGGPA